jgi:hypothetical protein
VPVLAVFIREVALRGAPETPKDQESMLVAREG